jgi:hypothetical protein
MHDTVYIPMPGASGIQEFCAFAIPLKTARNLENWGHSLFPAISANLFSLIIQFSNISRHAMRVLLRDPKSHTRLGCAIPFVYSLKNGSTILFTTIGPNIHNITRQLSQIERIERTLNLSLINPAMPKPTERKGNKYSTVPTGN